MTEPDPALIQRLQTRGKISKEDYEASCYVITSPAYNDPKTNPCIVEQNLVSKCMWKNNYAKQSCFSAFENYRECSKFWRNIKIKRALSGKSPPLPPEEERKEIKKEYMQQKLKEKEDVRKYIEAMKKHRTKSE